MNLYKVPVPFFYNFSATIAQPPFIGTDRAGKNQATNTDEHNLSSRLIFSKIILNFDLPL